MSADSDTPSSASSSAPASASASAPSGVPSGIPSGVPSGARSSAPADVPWRPADVPLRADARRNRDQILAAAKAVFRESGTDVPMEEIARQAGVGVGTLYRRFPDRAALIRAVARDSLERVLAEVRAMAEEETTAWDAIARLLAHSHELRAMVLLSLLAERPAEIIRTDPDIRRLRGEIFGLLDGLVTAAQRDGTLRPDIAGGDLAVMVSLLIRHFPAADAELADMMLTRATALVLDGLRAPGTVLPGSPVTHDDVS